MTRFYNFHRVIHQKYVFINLAGSRINQLEKLLVLWNVVIRNTLCACVRVLRSRKRGWRVVRASPRVSWPCIHVSVMNHAASYRVRRVVVLRTEHANVDTRTNQPGTYAKKTHTFQKYENFTSNYTKNKNSRVVGITQEFLCL